MILHIVIGATILTATLEDNSAARDFSSLLPLTLTLDDYAATEKVGDLPKRLSLEGVPAGTSATMGDIAYYAPWGNLAIFYRPTSYARGLVKLGAITSGVDALSQPGPLRVTIYQGDVAPASSQSNR